MTTSEFLAEIDDIVQAERGKTKIGDEIAKMHGWDSMARIMVIAMADEKLGITLTGEDLKSCDTIGGLARLCRINPDA